ncbi:MAG: hypothetical protein AAF320_00780 [Myxococcota bacterium]
MAHQNIWQQVQHWASQLLGSDAQQKRGDEHVFCSDSVSSGDAKLDAALPYRGWPCGFISWLQGDIGVGKTRLALSSVNHAQQAGATTAFLDATYSLCCAQIRSQVADPSRVLWLRPATLQQACCMCQQLVAVEGMRLIFIDGLMALPTQQELHKPLVMSMQRQYKSDLMKQVLSRLSTIVRGTQTALVIIHTDPLGNENMLSPCHVACKVSFINACDKKNTTQLKSQVAF